MLRCPNCHHEQEAGKFCGKCGTPVEEVVIAAVDEVESETETTQAPVETSSTEVIQDSPAQSPVEKAVKAQAPEVVDSSQAEERPDPVEPAPTVNVEEVRENAVKYWATLSTVLRKPSKSFALDERHFTFGIINILVYLLTFTLSVYLLVNAQYRKYFGGFSDFGAPNAVPFFEVFFRVILLLALFVAVSIGILIIFEKVVIKQMTFQALVAQFAGAITPFIVLNVLAILTALAAALGITVTLLYISFFFSFIIAPGLFLLEKMNHYNVKENRLYFSYGVSLAIMLALYIVGRLLFDTYIEDLVETLDYFGDIF